MADNIIVGTGPGTESQVKVFSVDTARRDGQGARRVLQLHAVSRISSRASRLATGMVEFGSGRESIVTAPGPGDAPQSRRSAATCTRRPRGRRPMAPRRRASGQAQRAEDDVAVPGLRRELHGGVRLSTGWVAGEEGGAKSIVTGQLGGDGTVRVWSTGRGSTASPRCTWTARTITTATSNTPQIASFAPFAGATPG